MQNKKSELYGFETKKMEKEIINRVATSALITFDLEDVYPAGKRVLFDIKDWLYEEIIFKEKEFRAHVQQHNWAQYQDNFIALSCSSDAIIPSWAFLLVAAELSSYAKKIVVGDLELLESIIFNDLFNSFDFTKFTDKRLIIKGCSDKIIPASAYTLLIAKLQPVAKTIMFGEACSTVPLYKSKK